MVKGLDRFRDYFHDFTDQYALIGGAACDISFDNNNADFRATRDLDIVLIIETMTREFGEQFWHLSGMAVISTGQSHQELRNSIALINR